jgi:hypothetical protein
MVLQELDSSRTTSMNFGVVILVVVSSGFNVSTVELKVVERLSEVSADWLAVVTGADDVSEEVIISVFFVIAYPRTVVRPSVVVLSFDVEISVLSE